MLRKLSRSHKACPVECHNCKICKFKRTDSSHEQKGLLMPFFDYECVSCGNYEEKFVQRYNEQTKCSKCGNYLKKLPTTINIGTKKYPSDKTLDAKGGPTTRTPIYKDPSTGQTFYGKSETIK